MQSPFSYSDSYASSYSSSPGGMDFFYGMGPPQTAPVFDSSFDLDPVSPFVPEVIPEAIPEVHPEIYSFTSSPYMYSPTVPVKEFPVKDFQMYGAPHMATSVPSPPSSTCGSACGWNGPEEVPMPSYPLSMCEDSCSDSPSAAK